jgi:hypothetical protein
MLGFVPQPNLQDQRSHLTPPTDHRPQTTLKMIALKFRYFVKNQITSYKEEST